MKYDGTGMFQEGIMVMFGEDCWVLKWREEEGMCEQKQCGKDKWKNILIKLD